MRHTYNTKDLAASLQAYIDLQTTPAKSPLPPKPAAALAHLSDDLFEALGDQPTVPATSDGLPLCPKCQAPMVLRTVRNPGPHHGNQFWGCRDYPRCRGVRAVGEKS